MRAGWPLSPAGAHAHPVLHDVVVILVSRPRKLATYTIGCAAWVSPCPEGRTPCECPQADPMKLLVIEDEPKTAALLRKGLSEGGFVVDVANDGEEGLHHATTGAYDLILLDLMLPGRDGWSILTELRRERQHTPVLCLTARDAVQDRVKGLELGADDYLVKPFAFSELLARVRSILRRSAGPQPDVVQVADLMLDLHRHKAARNGVRLDLTAKEFLLLSLLVRRTGEVLSRTTIAEQIWDMNFEGDSNVVDVHVRRLRSKVDDPFETKLIHTVRGLGYVLESR